MSLVTNGGGSSGEGTDTNGTNGTSEVSAEASKMTELQTTLEKQSSELTVLQRRLQEAEEALRAAQRDAQRSQELQARLHRDLHEKSAQNQDQVQLFYLIRNQFLRMGGFAYLLRKCTYICNIHKGVEKCI